jgi:hypothetical protein
MWDFSLAARVASGVTSVGAHPFAVSLAATRETASITETIVMLGVGKEAEAGL